MNLGRGSYNKSDGFVQLNIEVGNYSSIAEGCYFHGSSDNHLCIKNRKCVYTTNWDQPDSGKPIKIGHDVWIGHGVRVLPEIEISDGAIIGAGSVVTRNVPPFAVVSGNPARIRRFRFTPSQIKKLMAIEWWHWSEEKVADNRQLMKDIDGFLEKYA